MSVYGSHTPAAHPKRATDNQRRETEKAHSRPQEPLERALECDKKGVREADEGEEEKQVGGPTPTGKEGGRRGRLGDRRGTTKQWLLKFRVL